VRGADRQGDLVKELAVVGNGMATTRLLDELVTRGALEQFRITVYGDERGGGYNRILLGQVLAGGAPDDVTVKPLGWYAERGIRLHEGARVARLDPARGHLETAGGHRQRYDVAVLATGSQARVPDISGATDGQGQLRPGVFVYRTMEDCLAMRARARSGDRAVVLGGGLLGLEAARSLADLGLAVTVIHLAGWLMNTQLDQLGGEMLRERLEQDGLEVRTRQTLEEIRDGEVILGDRQRLPARLVVLACGVRPRVEVARAAGLAINRGIIVDDSLHTDAPGVYALGDCAEHAGRSYGLVAPAWEQAEVLADVLTGADPGARYRGSRTYARLKVAGVDVASLGIIEPELEVDEVLQVVENRRRSYRKLIVRGDRLVGATLVGNAEQAASLIQLFDRGEPLPADPLEILCRFTAGGAAGAVPVCNCHGVDRAAIEAAVAAGADSVGAVGQATRAGTGCGSCRSQLAELVRRGRPAPAVAV
jgi:nitrite reductase (NADH) large subunit